MKKASLLRRLLLATMLCAPIVVSAQVAIGTGQSPTATLQVVGTPSDAIPAGVIAPRVTVAALNAAAANYTTNQTGAIVYVTDATGASAVTKTGNITAAGYYYFDGTADVWQALGGGAPAPVPNVVRGLNSDYTVLPTDDFLIFATSGASPNITLPTTGLTIGQRLHIADIGNMGVGISNPSALLNTTHAFIYGGYSLVLIYIGMGQWEAFGGMQ